jgi:hypothetical protein
MDGSHWCSSAVRIHLIIDQGADAWLYTKISPLQHQSGSAAQWPEQQQQHLMSTLFYMMKTLHFSLAIDWTGLAIDTIYKYTVKRTIDTDLYKSQKDCLIYIYNSDSSSSTGHTIILLGEIFVSLCLCRVFAVGGISSIPHMDALRYIDRSIDRYM